MNLLVEIKSIVILHCFNTQNLNRSLICTHLLTKIITVAISVTICDQIIMIAKIGH